MNSYFWASAILKKATQEIQDRFWRFPEVLTYGDLETNYSGERVISFLQEPKVIQNNPSLTKKPTRNNLPSLYCESRASFYNLLTLILKFDLFIEN